METLDRAEILIFTGKGGVGKTTCAAATALRMAELGVSTLIVSTDPAHSLADCLQQRVGGDPTPISDNFWAAELNAVAEMRTRFDSIRRVLLVQMQKHGLSDAAAEEMIAFPGSEELFCLLKIVEWKRTRRFDVIVVDTAPTGNTIRFLNFPELLMPVRKALRVERAVNRIVRPFAALVRQEVLGEEFYSAIFTLFDDIARARDELLNAQTYFRFVLTPEKLALVETQRAVSFLNVSGYIIDAVVLNKVLPSSVQDPFFVSWKQAQAEHIQKAREAFYPLHVIEMPLSQSEVLGLSMLREFGSAMYRDITPLARLAHQRPFSLAQDENGMTLTLRLPYNEQGDIRLFKRETELVLNIGPYERVLELPAALYHREVTVAHFKGENLVISFA